METKVTGNPNLWKLLSREFDEDNSKVTETTAMEVPGGALVRVTTLFLYKTYTEFSVMTYVPGVCVASDTEWGTYRLWMA